MRRLRLPPPPPPPIGVREHSFTDAARNPVRLTEKSADFFWERHFTYHSQRRPGGAVKIKEPKGSETNDGEGGGGGAQRGGHQSGDDRSEGEPGGSEGGRRGRDLGDGSGGRSRFAAIDTKNIPCDASEPEVPDDMEFDEWLVDDDVKATVVVSDFDVMDTSPDPVAAFCAQLQICAH